MDHNWHSQVWAHCGSLKFTTLQLIRPSRQNPVRPGNKNGGGRSESIGNICLHDIRVPIFPVLGNRTQKIPQNLVLYR